MEEKKAEISRYLRTHVSCILTPLMEKIVKKRPDDILVFVKEYAEKMIGTFFLNQNRDKKTGKNLTVRKTKTTQRLTLSRKN